MKNKHLRERLRETYKSIEKGDENAKITRECIVEIAAISRILVVEALSYLEKNDKIGVEDDWLLDVFFAHDKNAEFEQAFKKICMNTNFDIDRIYGYSCLFFYRQYNSKNNETESMNFYRTVICEAFGEHIYETLIEKLRHFEVVNPS
jgi:hypothetical protein